jgi:murein DD-endopeptidase MepM/ murein hydrolase activator NlpD
LKYRLKVNKATGELMGHRHQGVDLPGRVETPVRVSADGVVVRNRPQGVPATAMKIGPDGKKHREPAFEPQRDVNGRIVYQEGKPVMVPTFKTAGYGNVVVVSHANGAYRTWYGHLEYQSNLKPGTQISRGSVLGLLGNTGNARGQGSHVHFGVQKRVGFDKNGQPIYIWIDPIDWMHGVQ